MEKEIKEKESLATLLEKGTATEEERGTALRMLQVQASANLLMGMSSIVGTQDKLQQLLDKALVKFQEKFSEDLDTLALEDMKDYIDFLYSKSMASTDLQRKVAAMLKDLMPANLLSDDEKKVIAVMNSIKSPKAKKAFLELVEKVQEPEAESFE